MRTGVDLIEIERIVSTLERFGDRFLRRVYTPREIAAYADRPGSLAARWAAKEAVAKALGCGIGAVAWTDIEILSGPDGEPELHLHGAAAARSEALGLQSWALSLSHTHEHAVAFVVAQ
ncbi:MAG: holo-[acyl-carrier-protein] synthase [Caldilineae bacterium]|nr:MAG: holo-[acyl-carrier-protein] synthase [Caldilineae bacterium]